MKKCALCNDDFISKSNRARFCSKVCKDKSWYIKNKAHKNNYGKQYYIENKNNIDARNKLNAHKYSEYRKTANKLWRENNPNYQNEYTKERKKYDLDFKLRIALRIRLNSAINGNYKTGSAVSDLGCSIEELKKHLESQFQEGMSWDNWTRDGWHIDHIIPLASFDLSNSEEFKKACHYTNLQPLWAEDNLSKGVING